MDAFGGGYTPKGMGGSGGRLYQAWSRLRNGPQDALGLTAQSLQEAGGATVSIVDMHAETDAGAKASLQSVWKDGPPAALVLPHDEPLRTVPAPVILSA
jgi:hypothetical protein